MALRTALTTMFGIDHPIVLAPMGSVAGGALAAAVSEGGGLGLLGAGRGGLNWLARECAIAEAATAKPWGIGFLTWAIGPEAVEAAIQRSPAAIMLSFGDPTPFAETILTAGIPLMVQVTDMDEARRALDVGANVVVAQGGEAGGHGGGRATLPFVPAVVDIAGGTPVLAAGGIADGRGLAAALMLGAAGALMGTRFEATDEALLDAEEAKAIMAAGASDTVRGRVLDIATEAGWPARYPARTLRNRFTHAWDGKESELESDESALAEFRAAADRGDRDYLPIWAGEAVDLVNELDSASALVARIAQQAEDVITAAGNTVQQPQVGH
ncbi:2-nitropropane dioxygenase-like enzyme [Mycobacterium sp. JS623]|uniref:NAD(P)H-dependent flavin oxidoreductase n=1 Tax=Mycobacterium sp. JS623 TaxID=212767 RepID=UPI0002A5B2BD|nr:nitronate monooxygenase [Mycobacterium sp. JS623]AGB21718.1 2-nitropropane dioxygenase-like enzyme [Mycobacterium sp. JS623]